LVNFSKGFIVAISPFNFTAIGGNLATGPAILGNVVLWKPALTTTRASWMFYQILVEAGVPQGTELNGKEIDVL
jgi:1-pyrroline-5-carboxylate dehydrogenase